MSVVSLVVVVGERVSSSSSGSSSSSSRSMSVVVGVGDDGSSLRPRPRPRPGDFFAAFFEVFFGMTVMLTLRCLAWL